MKHEWAFKHSVQMINQNPNVLPRRQLVPQVIRVPAGNRFELGTVTFESLNMLNKLFLQLSCREGNLHFGAEGSCSHFWPAKHCFR